MCMCMYITAHVHVHTCIHFIVLRLNVHLLKDDSLISLQASMARVSLTTPTLSSSNGITPSTTPPKTSWKINTQKHSTCRMYGWWLTTPYLTESCRELEPVFVSHVREKEGVDSHPLVGVLTTFEREQALLLISLLELVVDCRGGESNAFTQCVTILHVLVWKLHTE